MLLKRLLVVVLLSLCSGLGSGVARAASVQDVGEQRPDLLRSLLEISYSERYAAQHRWLFSIGPVAQFISGNPLEGFRLSFGGASTSRLSEHFSFGALGSYGFGDHRWKGSGHLMWSFVPGGAWSKANPQHFLRYDYRYDVHNFSHPISQRIVQTIFTWANRSYARTFAYVDLHQLHYQRTSDAGFGFGALLRHYTMTSSDLMPFGVGENSVGCYTMSDIELRANLGKWVRVSHILGLEDVLGGDYSQNLTQVHIGGTIGLGRAGSLELLGGFSYQWDVVPFMLLPMPSVNTTYFLGGLESFMLLRPLEFVFDQYFHWGFRWDMGGRVFGRLSESRWFPLRGILSFRGLWGVLSDRNNPAVNLSAGLPSLPVHSGALGSVPYMEMGVGVSGVLRYFSLEYVLRLSHCGSLRWSDRGAFYLGVSFDF